MSDTDLPGGIPDDEILDIEENEILDDELEIADTDLAGPTDDEPIFDELRPGDLRGDNS
jgi:hypothetical protein